MTAAPEAALIHLQMRKAPLPKQGDVGAKKSQKSPAPAPSALLAPLQPRARLSSDSIISGILDVFTSLAEQ
jgi:hypothetical protein